MIRAVTMFTLGACIALAQPSWTELAPTGTPPVARTGASAVYDSATDRMIVFGGRDGSGNNHSDVWVLTHANGEGATGKWIRLIGNNQAGSPPARSGHSAVYDSANNRMIIFGGCSANCAPVLNDVWVLANANGVGGAPVWTQLSPLGVVPAPRTNSAVGYDAAQNVMFVFLGQDGSSNPCSTFSDVWQLSGANGLGGITLEWYSPSLQLGFPPDGQNGASAVYDSATGAATLFGGMGVLNGSCQATNGLTESVTQQRGSVTGLDAWQGLIAEGAAGSPSPRSFATGAYDSTGGRMLVFGGTDTSGNLLNDVWSLSNATGLGDPLWSQFTPTGGLPPARSGHAAVFDSVSRRMIIFGGSTANGVANDVWVLIAPGSSGLSCGASTSNPRIVRDAGIAELVGDLLLTCSGGTPTPPGQPIPEYTVTETLNVDVTSRLLPEGAGLSEALAIVDEAFPAVPIPTSSVPNPGAPPQIVCTPLGSVCSETGTGGTPSPYQTQPNIFAGRQSNSTTLSWKIPIDPPGVNKTRYIRLTNVRANASQLGSAGFVPAVVNATAQITGTHPVPLANAQQTIAFTQTSLITGPISTISIAQCQPHNAILLGGTGSAAFDFSVQASEGFPSTFNYRNFGTFLSGPLFPPVLDEQNVTGFAYNTETGFYSPSLFTPTPTIGLSDFGTRILVSFGSVSAGTRLFVPTTITMTGSYSSGVAGQLQLVKANSNGNSAAGYVPVASTAMIGTTPVAPAVGTGSTTYAVYEVINADPHTIETATIPVAVAFTTPPAIGTVNETTSFAPLSTVATASQTAPIPRFTNFSSAQAAYSITACAGVKQ